MYSYLFRLFSTIMVLISFLLESVGKTNSAILFMLYAILLVLWAMYVKENTK